MILKWKIVFLWRKKYPFKGPIFFLNYFFGELNVCGKCYFILIFYEMYSLSEELNEPLSFLACLTTKLTIRIIKKRRNESIKI